MIANPALSSRTFFLISTDSSKASNAKKELSNMHFYLDKSSLDGVLNDHSCERVERYVEEYLDIHGLDRVPFLFKKRTIGQRKKVDWILTEVYNASFDIREWEFESETDFQTFAANHPQLRLLTIEEISNLRKTNTVGVTRIHLKGDDNTKYYIDYCQYVEGRALTITLEQVDKEPSR
jgi:hypothetical protein